MTTPPKSTPSHYMLPWSCPSCSNDPCRCEPDRPSDCPTLEDLELAIVEAVREVMRENGDLPERQSEPAETEKKRHFEWLCKMEKENLIGGGFTTQSLKEIAKTFHNEGFEAAIEYVRRGGKV